VSSESSPKPAQATQIEQHTVGVIPHDERHGHPRDLFTIWVGANIIPLTVVTGALAVVAYGLNFWASVSAIVVGTLAGGVFMALHSVQGPKLGIPQMIQSRGQFGAIGSIIPILIVIFMYVGYFAADLQVGGQNANLISPSISSETGQVVSAILSVVMVIFGYALFHSANRILTVVMGIAMIASIVWIITQGLPAGFFTTGEFSWGAWLGMVSIAATWALSFAPYVSDYSRYLPHTSSARTTFWASYLGVSIGSILPMIWGVMAALVIPGVTDAIQGIFQSMGSLGGTYMALFFFSNISINALNLYGATLCIITVIQTFRGGFLPRARARIVIAVAVAVMCLLVSLQVSDFVVAYNSFVLVLLYLLIPWSAINLVDFYLIRDGHYHLDSLFMTNGGVYGRFNKTALISYAIGIVVQLPFMYPPQYYKGFLVDTLGGADIAWIVGLLVTAPVYYLLAKRDVAKESKSGVTAEGTAEQLG
jgi:NCS1 nucleoside transporter family